MHIKWIIVLFLLFISFALKSCVNKYNQTEVIPEWNEFFPEQLDRGVILIYDYEKDLLITNNSVDIERASLPASTFKILNTLIVLEEGVVNTVNDTINWPESIDTSKYGYRPRIFKNLSVEEAFKASAGWAYVEMAKKIGKERYVDYLNKLDYGNGDLSIDDTDFWNFGDFAVTPEEQIKLLVDIYVEDVPFLKNSVNTLKRIMIVEENQNYILRAKTGWTRFGGRDVGWWVGYVERKENLFFFTTRIEKDRKVILKNFGSLRKEITKAILNELGAL